MDKMKVLVVGDVMIDKYVYVNTERFAPEAPIPVWDEVYRENRLGGAANVAHNFKSLGGEDVQVFLAGIVGQYDRKLIESCGIDTSMCVSNGSESTMTKTRYVDKITSRHLFRTDNIKMFQSAFVERFHYWLTLQRGHQFDAIIFSDYNKNTINEKIIEVLAPSCKLHVVDSKRIDLSMYKGAQLLKINELEYATQVARGPYTNVESMFEFVVVTHGSKGAELRMQEFSQSDSKKYMVHSENFPTEAVTAVDVTGCGDTHTAAMTFSLLKNGDIRRAIKFANACARNVVQKFGTSINDVNLVSLGV